MTDFGIKSPADDTAFPDLTSLNSLAAGNIWHSDRVDVEASNIKYLRVRFNVTLSAASGTETDVTEFFFIPDLGDTTAIPGNLGAGDGATSMTNVLRGQLIPFDGVPMNGTTAIEYTTRPVDLIGVQGFKLGIVNNMSVAFASSGQLANYLGAWITTVLS